MVFYNGQLVDSLKASDSDHYSWLNNGTWNAGKYQVFFKASWGSADVRDYTIRGYFPTAITLDRSDFSNDTTF